MSIGSRFTSIAKEACGWGESAWYWAEQGEDEEAERHAEMFRYLMHEAYRVHLWEHDFFSGRYCVRMFELDWNRELRAAYKWRKTVRDLAAARLSRKVST